MDMELLQRLASDPGVGMSVARLVIFYIAAYGVVLLVEAADRKLWPMYLQAKRNKKA